MKAGARTKVVFWCVFLLLADLLRAAGALTVCAPLERQVNQRTARGGAEITVAGSFTGTVDVIEARVVLADGTRRGTPQGWTTIARGGDFVEGRYSGRMSLETGGWYVLTVRARRGEDVLAETSIARVGVGDVFSTAGQSNSANYGRPRQSAKDDRVVYYNGKSFVPAQDPIPGGCGGGGSVWPILGDLLTKSGDVPVCFRSASLTWTEVRNWLPGVTCRKLQLYDNLVKCAGEFGKNGVRAVLWHQGESDSLARTSAETYCDRLKTVIESLNEDAGYAIPWYVAQASFHPRSKAPEEKAVADGQRRLWEKGIARKGPVTDDLLGKEYRSDGVHFNQRGLTTHAERWFETLSAEQIGRVRR
jgi:eukaryotic-like serine/threonine-protein kinase